MGRTSPKRVAGLASRRRRLITSALGSCSCSEGLDCKITSTGYFKEVHVIV